jgi:3-phenylpropionate/cinnamic acid dioxygenase small subunit
VSDPAIEAAVDALQIRYVRALDRRNMQSWLECFARDGAGYVCIALENEEQGLPLALMMDDSHERLMDRVKFITEVWSGTFEDYSTRHFVQRLDCVQAGPGLYAVESNFMVTYTTAGRQSDILVSGSYEDRVVIGAEGPRFQSKKAVLDTITTPRYLVYPV